MKPLFSALFTDGLRLARNIDNVTAVPLSALSVVLRAQITIVHAKHCFQKASSTGVAVQCVQFVTSLCAVFLV